MDRNRQAIMEKARAKRLRRAETRKGRPAEAEATGFTETVKELAQGATETLGNFVTATAKTIKHVVAGSSEPNAVPSR